MATAAHDPESLRVLTLWRDRLQSRGIPADELPDWAVPLLVEGLEDKARLDWAERSPVYLERNSDTWRASWRDGARARIRQTTGQLRAVLDAARQAMAIETDQAHGIDPEP